CALCYLLATFTVFSAPPTAALSTLSLHDALPISALAAGTSLTRLANELRHYVETLVQGADSYAAVAIAPADATGDDLDVVRQDQDRKSTRLNSSHVSISYAVFCLKKKTAHISTRK